MLRLLPLRSIFLPFPAKNRIIPPELRVRLCFVAIAVQADANARDSLDSQT